MTLAPLATPEQLAARLGVCEYVGTEKAQVVELLSDASDELRSICGAPITRMTSTVTLWADRHGRLELPALPVVSVDSVELRGVTVDPDAYRLRYRTLHLSTICRNDEVTVTFTHGWDPIPGELVKWTCVLAAAAKAGADATDSLGLTAGVGTRSESIDDYQVTVSGPEASGGDAATGLTLPPRICERLRATYGGVGLMEWLEVEG